MNEWEGFGLGGLIAFALYGAWKLALVVVRRRLP